jgi:proline dehydrogenase
MTSEGQRATAIGHESPLLASKEAVDANYDTNAINIIEHISKKQAAAPYIFVATHNTNSVDNCIDKMAQLGLDPKTSNIKFAQILGMSDHITFALATRNFNAYKLACFGDFVQVYPWLLRRMQENQDIFGAMQTDRYLLWAELKRRIN